jgi:hypothetical protein
MYKQIRVWLILVIVASLLSNVSVAKANTLESNLKVNPQQTTTVITVPMTVECDKLSGKVLAEARKRNLCPSSSSGGISPHNIVPGNCGTAYLFASNMGAGIAQFNMGAASTQGAMVIVSYSTSWVNWSSGSSGVVSGTNYPFSSVWTRTRVASTGAGYVTATMSGQATLSWGLICGFMYPSDSVTVTN